MDPRFYIFYIYEHAPLSSLSIFLTLSFCFRQFCFYFHAIHIKDVYETHGHVECTYIDDDGGSGGDDNSHDGGCGNDDYGGGGKTADCDSRVVIIFYIHTSKIKAI